MSRLWVIAIGTMLVAEAAVIFLGGIAGGGWMGGLVFSLLAIISLYEWVYLRNSTMTAREVADRMAIGFTALLLPLVLQGLSGLEAWRGW